MPTPGTHGTKIILLLIRISDSNSMKELTKLTRGTADANRHLPGADLLHRLGASPLRNPDEVGARLHRGPQFRAVTYRLPGTQTTVLQALGSATKSNVREDDNAFVELLNEVTSETLFDELVVADFGRLLRALDHLSKTWKASRRCRTIRHGGSVIDTTAPTAEMQFMMEAMRTVADAQSVVKRTQEGKMRAYLRGQYVLGRASLPLGYTKTRDKTIALARPMPLEVVREIVDVLGDPTLTNSERVVRASEAGGHSVVSAGRNRRRVPYAQVTNPRGLVERWYRSLDVWRTGELSVKMRLPSLLEQVRIELPVDLREDEIGRYYWAHYEVPLPDGGWAAPEAFEAAVDLRDRHRRDRTPTGGASAGSRRKPFTGFPAWMDGDWQYVLVTRKAGKYELRRRDKARATKRVFVDGAWCERPRGWGRTDHQGRDGEVIATIPAERLHRAVTQGLVQAAHVGLEVRNATQPLMDQPSPLQDDLREQLEGAKRTAKNARDNANQARSETLRRTYHEDAEQAIARVEELERELLRVATLTGEGRMVVDVDTVALALGGVADAEDHVTGPTADAVREVIVDFKLTPTGDGLLRWHGSLRVPMAGGVLVLGPATGTIETGTRRALAAARARALPARADEAATAFMRDGLDVDATAGLLEIRTPRRVAQTIRDHLKALGVSSSAASMLLAATPAPARQALWARLHGLPYPQHLSPQFAAHVAGAYLQRPVVYTTHRADQESRYQQALDALSTEGGWIPAGDHDRLLRQLGIGVTTLNYYLRGRTKQSRTLPPILREGHDGFGLIPCPHDDCDGWADVARVLPEVNTWVLCSTCHRLPDPQMGKIVFPEAYAQATEGTA